MSSIRKFAKRQQEMDSDEHDEDKKKPSRNYSSSRAPRHHAAPGQQPQGSGGSLGSQAFLEQTQNEGLSRKQTEFSSLPTTSSPSRPSASTPMVVGSGRIPHAAAAATMMSLRNTVVTTAGGHTRSSVENEDYQEGAGDFSSQIIVNSIIDSASPDLSFPWRLYAMLSDAESNGFEGIVSWIVDGTAFKVHQTETFVATILPRYFKMTKYNSFTRQLYAYDFTWIRKGQNRGGYFHPEFKQDDPSGCNRMERRNKKGDLDTIRKPAPSSSAATAITATTRNTLDLNQPTTFSLSQPDLGTFSANDSTLSQIRGKQTSAARFSTTGQEGGQQLSGRLAFETGEEQGPMHFARVLQPDVAARPTRQQNFESSNVSDDGSMPLFVSRSTLPTASMMLSPSATVLEPGAVARSRQQEDLEMPSSHHRRHQFGGSSNSGVLVGNLARLKSDTDGDEEQQQQQQPAILSSPITTTRTQAFRTHRTEISTVRPAEVSDVSNLLEPRPIEEIIADPDQTFSFAFNKKKPKSTK